MRSFLLLCLFPFSTIMYAQDIHLGTSKDNIEDFYIMSVKHNKKEGTAEVWDRIRPVEGQLAAYRKKVMAERQKDKASIEGFEKLGYYKRRIEYNCRNKTYRIMECVYYDLYGKILDNTDAKESTPWEKVPLSTMRADEFVKVCL